MEQVFLLFGRTAQPGEGWGKMGSLLSYEESGWQKICLYVLPVGRIMYNRTTDSKGAV